MFGDPIENLYDMERQDWTASAPGGAVPGPTGGDLNPFMLGEGPEGMEGSESDELDWAELEGLGEVLDGPVDDADDAVDDVDDADTSKPSIDWARVVYGKPGPDSMYTPQARTCMMFVVQCEVFRVPLPSAVPLTAIQPWCSIAPWWRSFRRQARLAYPPCQRQRHAAIGAALQIGKGVCARPDRGADQARHPRPATLSRGCSG